MNAFWRSLGISLLVTLPATAPATEQPEVIFDSGLTYPISTYAPSDSEERSRPRVQPSMEFGFPLESQWQPGQFERRQVHVPRLPQPFFVIGCDRISYRWLDQRKYQLETLTAIGFVVRCDSRSSYLALARHAHPLRLQAMQANGIAEKLNHSIYPALISRTAIEQ